MANDIVTIGMPKKGSSSAEFNEYYKRLRQLREGGSDQYSKTPLPNETFQQYQQRMADTGLINFAENPTEAQDAYAIYQLQNELEGKSRGIIGEQNEVAKTRLQELAGFLSGEESRKFNEAIPEIASSSQAQGYLETSGFGQALANKRSSLMADTSARLTEQGLKDRDIEIAGLGKLGREYNDVATAGVERDFSTEDLTRSEQLSRELARLGVVNPRGESDSEKFANYAGAIGSVAGGVGALK